jgi:microcystin-dependent protein
MSTITIPNSKPSEMRTSINTMLHLIDPLGTIKEYLGIPLPTGYLWANGCTIGDAESGATGRANADTIDLYKVLWEVANTSGSQIRLYDATGVATIKGTEAIADFTAHKRLSLPDKRGRAGIGLDSMGGTSADVVKNVNADVLGGADGEENHALISAENGPHSHTVSGGGYQRNSINQRYSDNGGGVNNAGALTTSTSGNGIPHNNMQPWVACNYIMRY